MSKKKRKKNQSLSVKRLIEEEKAIARLISHIQHCSNINQIFATATTEVRQILKADRVAIYRFNPDWSGAFIIESVAAGWKSLIHQQIEHPELTNNVSNCSIKYLVETQPNALEIEKKDFTLNKCFRICNDIYQAGFSQCYIETLEKYQARAYIIVTIYKHNHLWGLLAAYQNSTPRTWKKIDVKFLEHISTHFSIALQQNELLQQNQQQEQELKIAIDNQLRIRAEELAKEANKERALAQVIDKIRQTLDLETIFSTATREIRQLLDADRVGIFEFAPNTNYYEGSFISEAVIEPFSSALQQPVVDRCFGDDYATNYQQGNILVINDVNTANLSPCHREILERFQIQANLVLPLLKGKELWGLLCIHQCCAPRQWETEEIEFLIKITVQLGVALQQAELLFKAEKKTQELQQALEIVQQQKEQQVIIAQQESTISRIIESIRQTLDIDTIFQVTTQEIRQTLECDRVVVYRFFPDWNGEFVYESSTEGWTPLVVANMKTVWLDTYFQETEGGRYANHETFAVEDIYTIGHTPCHIELLEIFQIRAYMIAPVFAGDQLWGLLAAYQNTGPRPWQDREINLLARIGDQLGVAVQQAELLIQLREASEKAKAANHAKSEFLANMSHELRTPLNAILGFTQLLDGDTSLNPQQQEYISIIGRSGRHLLNLLNDVLEMSKIEAGRVTFNDNEFDLHHLLNTLEEMFTLKAQTKSLQLSFQCDQDVPPYIKTDERKLRQVLINLISNGIKFTESGYVILRVNCLDHQDSDYFLQFEVEDTGVGIEQQEMTILFEPFFQSESGRKSQEGTGLGLPISKQFVELMGGELQVESTFNQGTIFTFNIPVVLAEENHFAQQDKQKIIGIKSAQKIYRILIVDDKWESRLILKNMLSPLGFQVKEAQNGQQAVDIWKNWQPDLIWMDMRMPIMGGYEATKIIRKKEQEKSNLEDKVIIIALTASVFDTQRAILLQAGCNDFIPKPFREEMIFDKMAEYLNLTYIYENDIEITKRSYLKLDNKTNIDEIQTQITLMSKEWLNKLRRAVFSARESQIRKLIEQIPSECSLLKTTLNNLINSLNFEEITNLIEGIDHDDY
jgi:GAF domain-containing protein/DNA-binding response OmpR family regulator